MGGRRRRFLSLLGRHRAERALDAELRFHLEMEAAKNEAGGLSPAQARAAARRAFGNMEGTKESCRVERRGYSLEVLFQDLRYGLRALRRRPAYTFAAVLTLALGIGVNAAVFSAVHGVLLRPLPYAESEELVVVRQQAPALGFDDVGLSPPEIADVRSMSRTLEDLVEYHRMWFNLLGRGEPMRVQTGVVSHQFFDLLGLEAEIGRSFEAEDDRPDSEPVLMLSHEFWRERFGGDTAVVGEQFVMNDRSHTVIGVLPPIPQHPDSNDVYMPVAACPFRTAPATVENRRARGYYVFGRLRQGVSRRRAEEELGAIAARMAAAHPKDYPAGRALEVTVTPLREVLVRAARPTLLLLLATTGMVLLIACANVASLSLAQLGSRERELSLRRALGAGRGRLLRQLVTESSLLSLAGGLLAVLMAARATSFLATFAGRFTPRAQEIQLGLPVLLFTLLLSLAVGVALGSLIAWRGVRGDLSSGLREEVRSSGSRPSSRLRKGLVVAQLAVSVVLLTASGLLTKSLLNLERVDAGFEESNVLKARLDLDWSRYTTGRERVDFYGALLREISTLPGVLEVAVTSQVPLDEGLYSSALAIQGEAALPDEVRPRTAVRIVSPRYFETLRVPILDGRSFTGEDDAAGTPVAIVSRSLARRYWGDRSPVGRRISLDEGEVWLRVVGVARDVKQESLAAESEDEVYLSLLQSQNLSSRILVRTAGPPLSLVPAVRRVVHGIDPEQPVADFTTLAAVRDDAVAAPRQMVVMVGAFALLALVISATGMAGLLAFSVSQRVREIGVRIALGASRGSVLRLVLGQGLALVLGGLVVGALGGTLVSRALEGLLFQVGPNDPATLLAVLAVLLAAAVLACWAPAHRATRIEPMTALRND